LEKSLKFNPNQRLTVMEAIDHPLFDDIRGNYSNVLQYIGKPFYFELNDLTKEQIYQLVLQEQEYYQSLEQQHNSFAKIQE